MGDEIMKMTSGQAIAACAGTDTKAGRAIRNRLMRDSLIELLNGKITVTMEEPGTGNKITKNVTVMDAISEKALARLLEKPTIRDLKMLQEILGEEPKDDRKQKSLMNKTDKSLSEIALDKGDD